MEKKTPVVVTQGVHYFTSLNLGSIHKWELLAMEFNAQK